MQLVGIYMICHLLLSTTTQGDAGIAIDNRGLVLFKVALGAKLTTYIIINISF